jgi:uncharacterized protein
MGSIRLSPSDREAFIGLVDTSLAPLAVSLLYLFGSHGTPRERRDSDVDIGVLSKQPLSAKALENASEKLASALGKDIDLVDLRQAPLSLRSVIVGEGDCLISRDESLRDTFEMYTLSDYARLNEERAPIIKAIRSEVLGHG